MKLKTVRWSNYRRLADGEIDVRTHLVLVGPNDSGKSSVLRAIHVCLGTPGAQLGASIDALDFTDPDQPVVLEVVLVDFDHDDRAAFPDEISTIDGESLTVRVEATMAGDVEQKKVVRRFPFSGHERNASRVQTERFGWSYVPSTRALHRELGGGSTSVVRALLSDIDLAADQAAFDAAATQYREAIANAGSLKTFREGLAGELTKALPRDVAVDELEITTEADFSGDPLAGVRLTIAEGGHRAPLSEQSDGIRALSVLTMLGMAHPSARIVGVDEPEIHLHHTAQRSIAARFRSAPGQRVVVTHAPAVVQEMDPLDIVVMNAARAARQLPLGAAMAEYGSVMRFWAPNLIEPLTARRVLAVEGAADRILCDRVAQLLGLNLNRAGVVVFDLGGKKLFPRAYDLFGPAGFDVGVFGLLDEDARVLWADTVGAEPADLTNSGAYAVCDPDLEAVYVSALGVQRAMDLLVASPNISATSIEQSCGTPFPQVTAPQLIEYCRKHKIPAALAVAAGLTVPEAQALTPLAAVLQAATA